MALNSFLFICLFPMLCAVYYGLPARWGNARNLFLLLASYLIYMNWKPVFALVLLGITVLTFLLSLLLEAGEGAGPVVGGAGSGVGGASSSSAVCFRCCPCSALSTTISSTNLSSPYSSPSACAGNFRD